MALTEIPVELSSTPGIADSSNATAITIDSSERVLIGTDSGDAFNADSMLRIGRTGDRAFLHFKTDADQESGILFGDVDDDVECAIEYEPANKAMTFSTNNNTETLRMDSSGRVLIGSSTALSVTGGARQFQIEGTSGVTASMSIIRHSNSSGGSTISLSKSRATADSGVTVVAANDVLGEIRFTGADGSDHDAVAANIKAEVDGTPGSNDMPGRLTFWTTADGAAAETERMRILSDGEVVMAGASNYFSANDAEVCTMYCNTASQWALSVINDHASGYGMAVRSDSGNQMFFYIGGTLAGQVTSSGTSTTYGNASDYRLKENVSDLTGGIDRLKLLKPKRFNYIADETNTLRDGFIAHEAQTVIPEAVTGQKDDPINDKGIGAQQLDYGQITPLLTAALQEAIAKIETLEAKVKALEEA